MNAIAKNFGSSAPTYVEHASLQRDLGNRLYSLIDKRQLADDCIVLDLGCGPGLFTKQLQHNGSYLISADLALGMLQEHKSDHSKLNLDSHQLSFLDKSIDLVFSNLMIQWCDFAEVTSEILRVLKPGGEAVISTLLPGSLFELAQSWQSVDDDVHVHAYETLEDLNEIVQGQHWQAVELYQEDLVYWYDNAKQLARELKSLGANLVKGRQRKGLVTKAKWQQMEAAYQAQFCCQSSNKISATYKTLTIKLTKPF